MAFAFLPPVDAKKPFFFYQTFLLQKVEVLADWG